RHKRETFRKMTRRISRRRALKLATAASALPLVHIRTAGAAGKLTCAFWDHWVPAGNDAMRKIVAAWADQNKVDVQLDFLTAIGNKIDLTMGAEAVAKTGHDIFAFDIWTVHQWSDELTPVDAVMSSLIDKYGPVAKANEYLAKINGHWMAVPTGSGSAPLTPCARISMFKQYAGIDVQTWYPAHEVSPPEAEDWTYATQLKAAEACAKAGHAFGFGCGTTTDSVQTWGAMFGAFGADLVDAKGNVTVDSDNVRQVLEYAKKMLPFLPPDTVSYDDASNNRALISGKAAMIYNPPSAWAVAKRDAPQVAEDCWTFPNPKGTNGRLVPMRPYFWGIWTFAKNQSAAKDLLHYLMERPQVEALDNATVGYDIPPFLSMSDFPIWSEVEPPKGTVFNYPIRPWHQAEYYITGSSAPPDIAVQMWNRGTIPTMVAKLYSGNSIDQTIAWAKQELEGFVR
ncbi:MAG TPA: extracellular solute-binding protein, partial [Acetobacteraceae bacterium]